MSILSALAKQALAELISPVKKETKFYFDNKCRVIKVEINSKPVNFGVFIFISFRVQL